MIKKTFRIKNPHVRVNVYKLKNRLNTYYEDKSKDDTCELVIVKRQYNALFEACKMKKSKSLSIVTNKCFLMFWPLYFTLKL